MVYFPAEDTFLLLDSLGHIKDKKVLEMGCGSGIITRGLEKSNQVTAVDIDAEAVAETKQVARNSKVFRSNLFTKVSGVFDVIIFNPPYLPGEGDKTYAGGLPLIEKFLRQAKKHLAQKGEIYITISSLTGLKQTFQLFEKQGFKPLVVATKKISWETLYVIKGIESLGSKPGENF